MEVDRLIKTALVSTAAVTPGDAPMPAGLWWPHRAQMVVDGPLRTLVPRMNYRRFLGVAAA